MNKVLTKNRTYFNKNWTKEQIEEAVAIAFNEAKSLNIVTDEHSITFLNEKYHAEKFFNFLEGGPLEIPATYPAGIVGTTAENLKTAEAPAKCPLCGVEKAYFEIKENNY